MIHERDEGCCYGRSYVTGYAYRHEGLRDDRGIYGGAARGGSGGFFFVVEGNPGVGSGGRGGDSLWDADDPVSREESCPLCRHERALRTLSGCFRSTGF